MAGWCDPGWNNSKLTLELKNVSQYHTLIIKPGMKIGQMVFWLCDTIPEENSYAVKGQYNKQQTVTGSKGAR
jgi:deoxycytidine triphosphate deaminase